MVLAGGEWHGTRIVSRARLDASFTPVIDVNANLGVRYGRLWYLGEATTSALPARTDGWPGSATAVSGCT